MKPNKVDLLIKNSLPVQPLSCNGLAIFSIAVDFPFPGWPVKIVYRLMGLYVFLS